MSPLYRALTRLDVPALPLRDFINFYPYDLRCLPAVEALCVCVRS